MLYPLANNPSVIDNVQQCLAQVTKHIPPQKVMVELETRKMSASPSGLGAVMGIPILMPRSNQIFQGVVLYEPLFAAHTPWNPWKPWEQLIIRYELLFTLHTPWKHRIMIVLLYLIRLKQGRAMLMQERRARSPIQVGLTNQFSSNRMQVI
jgi:hypothetical protein